MSRAPSQQSLWFCDLYNLYHELLLKVTLKTYDIHLCHGDHFILNGMADYCPCCQEPILIYYGYRAGYSFLPF